MGPMVDEHEKLGRDATWNAIEWHYRLPTPVDMLSYFGKAKS